jgi:hypothetical protein
VPKGVQGRVHDEIAPLALQVMFDCNERGHRQTCHGTHYSNQSFFVWLDGISGKCAQDRHASILSPKWLLCNHFGDVLKAVKNLLERSLHFLYTIGKQQ